MNATPGPRERRRDATRAEILATAWRLAERDGIGALSLREIARECGMRAPSLYNYFPSKAAIHDAMFTAGYLEFGAAMDAIVADSKDPRAALALAITRFVEFCQASPARYQLLFTRAIPDWTPSQDAYAVSLAQFARASERLAELGIKDAADMDLWTALISGLAAQQLANDPSGERWLRLADDAAAMFLEHLNRRPR